MGVFYNGEHSISFISGTPSSFLVKRSWEDFHLIPESCYSTPIFSPKYAILDKPFTNKSVDYTNAVNHGLFFEPGRDQLVFYIDHDKWYDWCITKRNIESFINGKRLGCVFEDDPEYIYYGRFTLSAWEDGENYSKVSIGYDVDPVQEDNNYIYDHHDNKNDTIKDSWDDIHKAVTNRTYLNKYSLGDSKTVYLPNDDLGAITMQIVAFDSDIKTNGAYAPITWVAKEAIWIQTYMYPTASTTGGYIGSRAKAICNSIYNMLPLELKNTVITVRKYYYDQYFVDHYNSENVWIPSVREVLNSSTRETLGPIYSSFFNSNASRQRKRYGRSTGSNENWWLRSERLGSESTQFEAVSSSGTSIGLNANATASIVFGFCTG